MVPRLAGVQMLPFANAKECVIASLSVAAAAGWLASVLQAASYRCGLLCGITDENVLDRPIHQYISVDHLKTTTSNVQYRSTPEIDVEKSHQTLGHTHKDSLARVRD